MLYSVQSRMRSSRRHPLLNLQRKHGPFSRQPMKELRLSSIQNTSFEEIKITFTLALVKQCPHGQDLDRQGVFIKITPIMIIMKDFVDKCKIGSNSRNS